MAAPVAAIILTSHGIALPGSRSEEGSVESVPGRRRATGAHTGWEPGPQADFSLSPADPKSPQPAWA